MTCFMKRLLLQICLAWTVSGCLSAAEPAEWKAAAAKAVITPTEPMYLAGFANREVPAEGTAMELHAKSLAD
jgi:neutral ceramidase